MDCGKKGKTLLKFIVVHFKIEFQGLIKHNSIHFKATKVLIDLVNVLVVAKEQKP